LDFGSAWFQSEIQNLKSEIEEAVATENERSDESGRFCGSDKYRTEMQTDEFIPWVLTADNKQTIFGNGFKTINTGTLN
jgi:hypothetical protein